MKIVKVFRRFLETGILFFGITLLWSVSVSAGTFYCIPIFHDMYELTGYAELECVQVKNQYYRIERETVYRSNSAGKRGTPVVRGVSSAITDGKTLYYAKTENVGINEKMSGVVTKSYQASGNPEAFKYKSTIYKSGITGKGAKKIGTVGKYVTLITLDQNKFYFTELNARIYSMDLRCRNLKKILTTGNSSDLPSGAGRYIIQFNQKYSSKKGKFVHPLIVYNVRTRKSRIVEKDMFPARYVEIKGTRIRYAIKKDYNSSKSGDKAYQYNMVKGKKKRLM